VKADFNATYEERRRAAAVLRDHSRFVCLLHESPDGDSIGSTLALALALRRLRKDAVPVAEEAVPARYMFLPLARSVLSCEDVTEDRDVCVLIDCSDPERAGRARHLISRARIVLNIDHHLSNSSFGDVNYVDPEASAAAEMIAALLEDLDVTPDRDIATCLYTGLMTDTGGFRHCNTTAASLRLASDLTRLGADPHDIAQRVYERMPESWARLLSAALSTLKRTEDGRVAWMAVTRDMLAAAGAGDEESEGLINYARMIDGVEVAALFKELDDGRVKVGLRSRHAVDVSRVASEFGGGGHRLAAGCVLSGSIDDAVRRVVARARHEMGSPA